MFKGISKTEINPNLNVFSDHDGIVIVIIIIPILKAPKTQIKRNMEDFEADLILTVCNKNEKGRPFSILL